MANTKPFVQLAAFCENLLIEADKAVTPVRVVDTYYVERPQGMPPEMVPAVIIRGIIALKSGDVTGNHTVGFVMENTQGVRKELSPPGGWPVVFGGGEQGVNVQLKFPLGVQNFGLCWFDVLFDGELLTRMPLMLKEGPAPVPAPADSQR
jgi:hypothetical protein